MKFKNGDQCYFDILGNTNKSKTFTVTVVKKKMFGRYVVISDQTKEVFSINKRHLTPINPNNDNQFFIRRTNPLISFDIVDYSLLKNTMKAIDALYDEYLSKKLDSDYETYKNLDIIKQEINKSISTILSKMSIILKNEEEHEVVKNLIDRDYRSALSIINNISNNSSNNNFSYPDFDIKNTLTNFMIDFRSEFPDPDAIYYSGFDGKELTSNSEVNNYFNEHFPRKLFNFSKDYPHDFILVTKCDIEDKSKRIFESLQHDSSLDGVIIPYIDKSSNKVKTMLFDDECTIEDINKTISSIFIDDYEGKISFNILIVFDLNIDEFIENEEEEDDYE